MLHLLKIKIILTLVSTVLYLTCSIVSAAPNCCQNALSKEDIICTNVQNIEELFSVGQKNWKKLKIINEEVKQLNWNEISQELSNLEIIDLSRAGELLFSENGFDNLPNLISLNVSNCKLESLENSFLSADNKVKILDASWNLLENLKFDRNNKFRALEVANFSHNEIQSIDIDGEFKNLKILHLDYNELKSISLCGFPNLNILTMGDNFIEKLTSNSFENLHALEELVITSCPLSEIEDRTFQSMTELKNLNLSANSLEQLSPDVFAGLSHLLQLDLNSNNLNKLVHLQFQHLVKVQYLDLSRNSLKFLNSSNFNSLANLRKLFLYENDIADIKSNTFSNLISLDTLDLSYNAIDHLDAELFGSNTLPRLRKLMLKSNNLKYLHPLTFASLPFLEYLSLGFNQLTSLDVRMFAPMRRLEKLHLGNNLLETISGDVLETFTDIKELLLDKNRLSFLSNSNATFSKLEKVSLEGNPWQCPCWDEMTQWLEDRGVSYVRPQSPYFKGQKPLCVVTPVDVCVKNLQLVKKHKIEEIYNSA